MTNKQLSILVAALSAVSLTGCSGSGNEPAPIENGESAVVPSPKEDPMPAPTAARPAPIATTPATENSAAEVPPEEAPAPDEQMMDDAAATGMTARSTRGEPATTETAPAEQVERK